MMRIPMMTKQDNIQSTEAEALIAQIKQRAENLYLTRQLLCAESVVVTLNKALGGGLSDDQAVAVAAPFSAAMGDSGCICGALSGAVLACGLFVGGDQPHRNRKRMRHGARQLHDAFRAANGATCCRVLTRNIRDEGQSHFLQCARYTATGAEIAARLILCQRTDIRCTENGFLQTVDGRISVLLTRLRRLVCQKE